MTKRGRDDGVDVRSLVAATAERIHKQLAEVSSLIRDSLEEEIPELRGDPRLIELLDASVEGNVETLLHALRYDIAVRARRSADRGARVCATAGATRGARQRACARVPAGSAQDERACLPGSARPPRSGPTARLAVLDAITATLFEYIDWISPAGGCRLRGRTRTMAGESEQHPGAASPRGSGRQEGRRRRRDQQVDPLSVALASRCRC